MPDGQITTTSFIPKTRLTASTYRRKSVGIGFFISLLLLLLSAGVFGGLYFYKKSLRTEIDSAAASLELAKKAFDENLIAELNRLNSSINVAKILFNEHQATSQIFKLIGDFTLKDVSFSNFSYNFNGKSAVVSMNGEAKSYANVAIQAKMFEESDFIDKVIFSGLSLKGAGKVSFNVELSFNPSYAIYKP